MNDTSTSPDRIDSPAAAEAGSPAVDSTFASDLGDLEGLRTRAQERDHYLDLLKRNQAEFENYQKRSQKDREQERKYYHRSLVLDLLPVLDNFERALAHAQQSGETGAMVEGVGMVQTQFLDILKRHGITRIDAAGQAFDPNLHQAVMQQPKDDVPPGMVVMVLEPGYLIHDRVLRPARVAVSVASAS